MEAFELYEALGGSMPDFVVIPSSACGHVRGVFKGFRELRAAGLTSRLPRMVVVQAASNSPLVSAIKKKSRVIVPFKDFTTVAEALTSGNPPGGEEILDKALEYGWLAEDATEEEILESQLVYARAGFFVEPGTATTLAGLKDLDVFRHHDVRIRDCALGGVETELGKILEKGRQE
jgi:threonine synthase